MTTAPEALRQLFNFSNLPNVAPRYNIAPSQMVPVVRPTEDASRRELVMMRWGLIPNWAEKAAIGYKTINARVEGVATNRSFAGAFERRRCLVPADGFYEWRKVDDGKQPYRIGLKGGGPFAFAGLWEAWRGDP